MRGERERVDLNFVRVESDFMVVIPFSRKQKGSDRKN